MCHVIQIIIIIIIITIIVITPRPFTKRSVESTLASAPRPAAAFSRPLRKGQLRTSHTNALTTSATGIDLLSRLEDADDREPDGTNVQLAQV